jgi:homospermidine synthase
MLIATFGPTTAWVGMQITREGDAFVLEGHGPISAGDIMEYDRRGHLVWVDAGTRAWVGSKAQDSQVSNAAAASAAATPSSSDAQDPMTGVGSRPSSHTRTYLKRALLLVIAVLIVANVVLILAISGAFKGP